MYKNLLKKLRTADDGWCVSIVIPTEKGFQDHKMTDAALKGAFKEAEHALEEKGMDKRELKEYMERIHQLAEGVDFAHSEDGIGFFVNRSIANVVDFPFPVDKKVVVDSSFEVRDLVYGAGSLEEYFFLTLNKHDSKLYYGSGKKMWDVTKHREGLEDLYVDVNWGFEKGHGDNDTFQAYLQHVDKNLGQYLNKRKLPVVLGGPDEAVNYFYNHSHHQGALQGRLHGSFDQAPDSKLHEALEPVLAEIRQKRAEEMKGRLSEAEGQHKASQGIGNIWPLAREGRIDHLIIERGYSCPAFIHDHQLFFDEPDSTVAVQVEDAVDDLIEMVLNQHGDVFFLPQDSFEPKVAALLRY